MSGGVCAVMLVKDEADIIETTIRHLLWHVDEVLVADNLSSDGTNLILHKLERDTGRVHWSHDNEIGYYQDRKTTGLAMEALARGHRWVIPVDADEIWQHNDPTVAIKDHLGGVGPDVGIFRVPVFNHLCTVMDDTFQKNPVKRIRWRQRKPGMFKVICRLRPDLYIEMGNHGAQTNGKTLTVDGPFNVRHFSWRSEDQFLRKIVNGRAAYAATSLPATYGVGWRCYDGDSDEQIKASFHNAFEIRTPQADITLIEDPAPLRGGRST
jgi:glycosyltransferase involved in cell wall biosynthesis